MNVLTPPLMNSGTQATVSSNPDVNIPAGLPSVVGSVVDSAPVSFSYTFTPNIATPVVTGVTGSSRNIDVRPFTRTELAGKTTDSFSDSQPLVSPSVPADQSDFSVVTPGKAASKMKTVLSCKPPHTHKKHSPVSGKVKLKLPPSVGVIKNVSSSRSKSPSAALSTAAQHTRRAVLSSAQFCTADDEKVLLIISGTFKSGNLDPMASFDDR